MDHLLSPATRRSSKCPRSTHGQLTHAEGSWGTKTYLKIEVLVADGNVNSAIWIGTNDLGPSSFFTDNRLDLTLLDYIDCVYEQLDALHEVGARNFVLLNLAPLNYAPMYALPENGGTLNTSFWKDEGAYNANVTQVSEKMRQYVALVNSIYSYRTSEEVQISDRYPESSFTIFDVHSLVSTSTLALPSSAFWLIT